MESKIHIGKGTMFKFKAEYNELNNDSGNVVNASQLFPTKELEEGYIVFEYIIYYKSYPKQPEPKQEVKQESKPDEPMRI